MLNVYFILNPSPVILHDVVSSPMTLSHHFVLFCPAFLIVLSRKVDINHFIIFTKIKTLTLFSKEKAMTS